MDGAKQTSHPKQLSVKDASAIMSSSSIAKEMGDDEPSLADQTKSKEFDCLEISEFVSPRVDEATKTLTERAEEDDDDDDEDGEDLEELILLDEMDQEERENKFAGDEDAEMLKEQQLLEKAIEKQINELTQKENKDQSAITGKKEPFQKTVSLQRNADGEIDLDKIKNEFHEVDFHPLEAKPPDKYMYSVYYDNV